VSVNLHHDDHNFVKMCCNNIVSVNNMSPQKVKKCLYSLRSLLGLHHSGWTIDFNQADRIEPKEKAAGPDDIQASFTKTPQCINFLCVFFW